MQHPAPIAESKKACGYDNIDSYVVQQVIPQIATQLAHIFLADHNITSKKQYGFKENYSTCMAITDLVDKISSNINNKNIVSEYFFTSARPLTQ